MAYIDLIDPRELDDEDAAEWSQRLTRQDGSVGNHFKAEAHFPSVMRHVYEARTELAKHHEVGPTLDLKIALAISMANECTYCTGAFCNLLSQRLGGNEAGRSFQQALASDELEGKESDIIDFVLKVHEDPHGMTEDDYERLRERYDFSDQGFISLIYAANIFAGYNRITVGLDLPYDHDYPEEWARSERIERPWITAD